MKPEHINPTKLNSDHIQIIGKCGTFGFEQIRKEILFDEIKKHGGDCVKLGVHPIVKIKTPKFSIGETVETTEDYEDIDCPPEHGTVTNIIENNGDVLYELNHGVLIYEKWLRTVG